MFKNYLKTAFRSLLRHKLFSVINIIGLSISLSICLIAIKMIFSMYERDRFHDNKNQIYRVISHEQSGNRPELKIATSTAMLTSELQNFPEIDKTVRIRKNFSGDAVYNERIIPVDGYFAEENFFDLFSFKLLNGNRETALKDPFSIVITRDLADKFFPDSDPIGEVLHFDELGSYNITGIIENISQKKTHLRFEILASYSTIDILKERTSAFKNIDKWNNIFRTYTYILLNKKTDISSIEAGFPEIIDKYFPESNTNYKFSLQALTKISPGKQLANPISQTIDPVLIIILMIISVLICLTSAFTYTNLSVARSLSRAKEVGIRKVVGAGRSHLLKQFIIEAIILSLIALNFAYLITLFVEPLVHNLENNIKLELFTINNPVLLYISILIFTIFLGFITGFAPSIYLSRFKPSVVLKDISKIKTFSRTNIRKAIIVFQFAISFILVFAVTIAYNQTQFQKTVKLGFNPSNIINADLQDIKHNTFKDIMLSTAGVIDISFSQYVPATGSSSLVYVKFENNTDSILFCYLEASENFLNNLDFNFVAGANYPDNHSTENNHSVIINQTAVTSLGFNNPNEIIGKSLSTEGRNNGEIIGFVEDFILSNTDAENRPIVLRADSRAYQYANIKINKENQNITLENLRKNWKKLDPVHLFRSSIYEEELEQYQQAALKPIIILSFLAILVIIIAFLGLLGMVVFNTESRIKEIGIRKVMGAGIKDSVWTISKGFIKLIIISILLSTPITWFLANNILQDFNNHIRLGITDFLPGMLLVTFIGLAAILSQTIKTGRKNPADILRYE